MQKIIFLILFLIFLLSCNDNSKVIFGNQQIYKLGTKEKQIKINPHILAQYNENIKTLNCQIPLNKYIEGENYNIYIGIPLNTNLEELVYKFNNPNIDILCDIKNDANKAKIFYKQHDSPYFVFATLYKNVSNKELYLINFVSQDSIITQNAFDRDYIFKHVLK